MKNVGGLTSKVTPQIEFLEQTSEEIAKTRSLIVWYIPSDITFHYHGHLCEDQNCNEIDIQLMYLSSTLFYSSVSLLLFEELYYLSSVVVEQSNHVLYIASLDMDDEILVF